MKAKIIAIMLVAIVQASFGQPAPLRRIDPLAMQMQEAVLKAKDIRKIEELLKQGVDINAPIGCGTYSPLDGAVDTQNLGMLKFLLAHGARPRGRELANAAFIQNHKTAFDIARVLLLAGVDPNAPNRYSTPLISAAYQDNRELVAVLLSQPGIKFNAQDVDGYTALMWAADHDSLDLVHQLIRAGANPNLTNKRGDDAYSLAKDEATRRAIIPRLEFRPNNASRLH
jgi:uncharacterized protein